MVVFSPVAQQPSSGIEDRLQAIQEILRCSNQQTVIVIDNLVRYLVYLVGCIYWYICVYVYFVYIHVCITEEECYFS